MVLLSSAANRAPWLHQPVDRLLLRRGCPSCEASATPFDVASAPFPRRSSTRAFHPGRFMLWRGARAGSAPAPPPHRSRRDVPSTRCTGVGVLVLLGPDQALRTAGERDQRAAKLWKSALMKGFLAAIPTSPAMERRESRVGDMFNASTRTGPGLGLQVLEEHQPGNHVRMRSNPMSSGARTVVTCPTARSQRVDQARQLLREP